MTTCLIKIKSITKSLIH